MLVIIGTKYLNVSILWNLYCSIFIIICVPLFHISLFCYSLHLFVIPSLEIYKFSHLFSLFWFNSDVTGIFYNLFSFNLIFPWVSVFRSIYSRNILNSVSDSASSFCNPIFTMTFSVFQTFIFLLIVFLLSDSNVLWKSKNFIYLRWYCIHMSFTCIVVSGICQLIAHWWIPIDIFWSFVWLLSSVFPDLIKIIL